MRFICLKYLEKSKWQRSSEEEKRVFLEEGLVFDNKLQESGHFFSNQALEIVGGSAALRYRNGQIDVSSGHSGDEFLGGFLFLEARDLNHAILLVANHPVVRIGAFEIHPVEIEERIKDRFEEWTHHEA